MLETQKERPGFARSYASAVVGRFVANDGRLVKDLRWISCLLELESPQGLSGLLSDKLLIVASDFGEGAGGGLFFRQHLLHANAYDYS